MPPVGGREVKLSPPSEEDDVRGYLGCSSAAPPSCSALFSFLYACISVLLICRYVVLPVVLHMRGIDFEYEYEDGEEYDYGSDNDAEAEDDLIEIENAFYEGDGERW